MKCSSLLLHGEQANVRKCRLHMLGSITDNLMGEPHAAHSGPWFCLSSIRDPMLVGSPRKIPIQGGDRTGLLFRVPESLVKIAQFYKLSNRKDANMAPPDISSRLAFDLGLVVQDRGQQ